MSFRTHEIHGAVVVMLSQIHLLPLDLHQLLEIRHAFDVGLMRILKNLERRMF